MKSFRDLDIFQKAVRLAIKVHELTLSLPKFELYEEGSQIRRSSKSIASTIAEGFGRRRYKADFIKFLIYSHAECDETVLHLDFLFHTKSMTDDLLYYELKDDYIQLSKQINAYIKWVELHWNEFPINHDDNKTGSIVI